MNALEVIESQNAIIKIQSDAINELFEMLMQHISAEEADKLQVVEKINLAAQIREGIER
ncbi:MAG: hypothetical protein [Bacteriophage sp.]|nr:MAG: hypothetical protein [Bacteriophage sp.]